MATLSNAFGKATAPLVASAVLHPAQQRKDASLAQQKKRKRSGSDDSDDSGELLPRGQKKKASDAESKKKRTVFVGNLSLEMTAKKLAKHFQTYLRAQPNYETWATPKVAGDGEQSEEASVAASAAATGGQNHKTLGCRDVESVRFRSVPIAPTKVAPGSDYKHMIKAAVALGKVGPAEGAGAAAGGGKKVHGHAPKAMGTGSGKAKDTQNAYIVFNTVAAATVALGLNGSQLDEHTLRVDSAATGGVSDYKRTLFCGNLSYGATEDEVRGYFGKIVSGGADSVDAVRIIRDKITQTGKGIAYVTFKERTHVAEALGGVQGHPFEGRELRVQRAKAPHENTTTATGAPLAPKPSGPRPAKAAGEAGEPSKKRPRHADGRNAANSGGREGRLAAKAAAGDQPPTKTAKVKLPAFAGARGDDVAFKSTRGKKGHNGYRTGGNGPSRGGAAGGRGGFRGGARGGFTSRGGSSRGGSSRGGSSRGGSSRGGGRGGF